jgi:hypothetical protein
MLPQLGALVDQHVGAALSNMGISIGGARLVVTAAKFVLFLIVAAMTGLLRIGVRVLSLVFVARNSIKAIEGGCESDAKAILAHLCILASIEFIEKTPLSIILDAIPFFDIIKATFVLVCSTPSTGVAMKVYRALAEPYFGAGNVFSNSPSSSSTSMAPVAPLDLCCPILKELFVDPVTAADGETCVHPQIPSACILWSLL